MIVLRQPLILCARLCIAIQNLSNDVNVISEGSPSRILKVRRISFGITIRPRSSTRRTMPVAPQGQFLRALSYIFSLFRRERPMCRSGFNLQGERHTGRSLQAFYKLRCQDQYL